MDKVIATRLGMNENKDNILLSDLCKNGNICEDLYTDINQIVIDGELKDIFKESL